MVVASANEFRVNQRKYLDLVRRNIQVFLKQGEDLFAITAVSEQEHVDYNPVWVEHMKDADADIKAGRVTTVKNDEDVWKIARQKFEKQVTH